MPTTEIDRVHVSSQPCGCDPGLPIADSFYKCKRYPDCSWGITLGTATPGTLIPVNYPLDSLKPFDVPVNYTVKPPVDEKAYRKARPVYSGVLAYFPDALLAVSNISQLGNNQHNPGEPLRWTREKSTDQLDAATRHLIDHAKGTPIDTDGGYHLAKAAWRLLAELQLLIEKENETV